MKKEYNIFIIIIAALLYFLNQRYKLHFENDVIRFIMSGYFNDFICAIAFSSYINLITSYSRYKIKKLNEIIMIVFVAGFFWEFITPLYKRNSTMDYFDIIVYILGAFIYWLMIYFEEKFLKHDR